MARPTLSTDNFINKAKNIHKNKFDYSKSIYKGSKSKVKIICKTHGIFLQSARHHLSGAGCKKCIIDSQRKSVKEFIKDAKKFHGNYYNYSLVKFSNIHQYIKIICPSHGIFKQTVVHHQRGQGCKYCSKGEVWDTKSFIKKSKSVHKNKYDYSNTNYSSTNIKVNILCNKCKHVFNQTPNSHIRGCGCPNCAGKIPISEEIFKEILRDVHGSDIVLISKYQNKSSKIKVRHICGHTWHTSPNHLIKRQQGCRKCYYLTITMTDQAFKKILKEKHDGTIIPLEKYKTSKHKIQVKCLGCSKKYYIQPKTVMRHGCHNCANRKTHSEFVKELKKVSNGEIVSLTKYTTMRGRILVRHKCGYEWKVTAGELIRKDPAGCPLCATSKGNKTIFTLLKRKKINFETEKRFKDCKYKIPLPFDFYIPSKKLLIEYDGEQHFIAVDFWGGTKGLEERIYKDKTKDNWVKKKKMKLLRIKYSDDIKAKIDLVL